MVGTVGIEPTFVIGPLFYRQSEQPVARVPKMEESKGVHPSSLAGATVFKTVQVGALGTFPNWR